MGKEYDRIDVICDRYFENSLKTQTRESRGRGSYLKFDDETQFPNDFRENFLKNSANKDKISNYLANKFLEFHHSDKVLVVTKNDTILTNDENLLNETSLTLCSAEEAGQKVVRHMIQCTSSGYNYVIFKPLIRMC